MIENVLLNIGSGDKKLPGFINIDLEEGADLKWDVTKGLPFPDHCAKAIYSEHFIEHISQAEGYFFFRECRRVLQPSGRLRLATPDLDDVVQRYAQAGPDSAKNPLEWMHPDMERFGFEWVVNRAEYANICMREWGHQWLYNEEEMRRVATFTGLAKAKRFNFGESSTPELQNLEHRRGSTLIMEFEKPNRGALPGTPLVSLLIPAYNPEFLPQALMCILAQDYPNLELIVSDDNPGEDIKTIIDQFQREHGDKIPTHYFPNEAHGETHHAIDNHVNVITKANGDFLKFLNDDDLIAPNCVSRLVDAMQSHPECTLATSHRREFTGRQELIPAVGPYQAIVEQDTVLDGVFVAAKALEKQLNFIGEPTCTLFRRCDAELFQPHILRLGGQKNITGTPGDLVMWLNQFSLGSMIYLTEPLSFIRKHDKQDQRSEEFLKNAQLGWSRVLFQGRRLGLTLIPQHQHIHFTRPA